MSAAADVQRAREVIDNGAPELIQAVDRGDIAVSVAAGLATASEAIQRHAVAEPERAHVLVKQERRAQRETELGAKQLAWPTKVYGVIYADPPWPWTSYSQITGMDRAPSYPTMDLGETTIRRDLAPNGADDRETTNQNNAPETAAAPNGTPGLSGAALSLQWRARPLEPTPTYGPHAFRFLPSAHAQRRRRERRLSWPSPQGFRAFGYVEERPSG